MRFHCPAVASAPRRAAAIASRSAGVGPNLQDGTVPSPEQGHRLAASAHVGLEEARTERRRAPAARAPGEKIVSWEINLLRLKQIAVPRLGYTSGRDTPFRLSRRMGPLEMPEFQRASRVAHKSLNLGYGGEETDSQTTHITTNDNPITFTLKNQCVLLAIPQTGCGPSNRPSV